MKTRELLAIITTIFCLQSGAIANQAETYEPDWESLSQHNAAPEWLADAKLGIYFHWGVYSVPAYGNEWYPRWMYFDGHPTNQHHTDVWGTPEAFGYHDFVPEFTAQNFDPNEWAELFASAGARFAGPVAEHHDGFSMWDSDITPWNAADKGPQRDVLGELFTALEKRGMHTIATFHHARNLQRYRDSWEEELDKWQAGKTWESFTASHYPYVPGLPTTSEDPELRYLYGNLPEEQWLEEVWLGKLKEVINKYQPDIIWFDSWLDQIPESYRQRFAAYYLNAAQKWNKEVAIVRKQDDLPLSFTINDHEKSREPRALPDLWMTDDTISTGSWCYTASLEIKDSRKVIHSLIDTVAKNGVLLLNISPMADGSIPEDQRKVLLELGQWLEANGEAIYGTRPWFNAAEGPTVEPEGGFSSRDAFRNLEYTARDIRYTASKDGKTVYAIVLGTPSKTEPFYLKTPMKAKNSVKSVSLLNGRKLGWRLSNKGFKIQVPTLPEASACVFKIEYY